MVGIRLEEFLSSAQPYEKRVHNLACFLAGRKRATDLALQALELAYQAFLSGSLMEDETIYRIACSVLLSQRTSPTNGFDLSPSFGAALFLRDALGLAYPKLPLYWTCPHHKPRKPSPLRDGQCATGNPMD